MNWEKSTIGEHCEITSSKRIFYSEYVESGVPFYRSKEIIEKYQGQAISEPLFISRQKYIEIKNKFGVPQSGDLLLTSVGTIGIPYIVKYEDEFYFKDGNLTWFRKFDDKLFAKYLYYWILSTMGKGVLLNSVIGSSQKALTIAALKTIRLSLPPIETQKRIADILSAYDDLIESNQKQIKLLEEAAQRLYKEWFIDLHFPGHETTSIVNGIPEGWECGRADSFFEISIGKTPPRAESQWFTDAQFGVPWASISDMGECNAFISETAEGLTREAVDKFYVKLVPLNTVLLSFKLTVGRVAITSTEMCTNEAIAHFQTNEMQRDYVYLYLKSFQYDTLGSTSSISKAVNSKIVKSMPFVMPSKEVLLAFERVVRPYFDMIHNKSLQIKQLKEARDRLLSKLMSGEMEV